MDQETARLVVIGGAAVGALVWMVGLTLLLRASRELRMARPSDLGRFEVDEAFPAGTVVGEAEVAGDPEELSSKLAGLLAREAMGPFGPVKIMACDRRELAFEAVGPSGLGFRRGRVRFSPKGPRTRLDYAIETSSRGATLLGVGWAVLALGLVVLVVMPAVMLAQVASSPFANVRAQSMQVVQICHILWPPFLFAHLARVPARMLRARMDSLIHNLPYS